MFCVRPDGGHSLLHPDCDPDVAPAFCAAFASLSGMLDDCETQDHLDEAVRHAVTLLGMETVNQDDLHREVTAVFDEVSRWGRQAERDIAESN
jgi:hypothetical protein